MTKILEEAVAQAAETVAAAAAELRKIEDEIATLNRTIAIARQECERHQNFAMTLGDARALAIVQKARAEQSAAEARLADLRNRRWPAAAAELAEAERLATNARRAANKPHVDAKKRERAAAAARIDRWFDEIKADIELYRRLGLELSDDPVQGGGGTVSGYEALIGLRRIAEAMPACLKTLPATDPTRFVSLAVSETRFWNLAPAETTATKAA